MAIIHYGLAFRPTFSSSLTVKDFVSDGIDSSLGSGVSSKGAGIISESRFPILNNPTVIAITIAAIIPPITALFTAISKIESL